MGRNSELNKRAISHRPS